MNNNGKPSTRFPPERLEELAHSSFTINFYAFQHFILRKSIILKKHTFSNFTGIFLLHLTRLCSRKIWLIACPLMISNDLPRKINPDVLVENECITSQKNLRNYKEMDKCSASNQLDLHPYHSSELQEEALRVIIQSSTFFRLLTN